jgi:hypothetical protein
VRENQIKYHTHWFRYLIFFSVDIKHFSASTCPRPAHGAGGGRDVHGIYAPPGISPLYQLIDGVWVGDWHVACGGGGAKSPVIRYGPWAGPRRSRRRCGGLLLRDFLLVHLIEVLLAAVT